MADRLITAKPQPGTILTTKGEASDLFQNFLDELEQRINYLLGFVVRVPEYTVATVPAAATYTSGLIAVTDETGGYTLAFSDGTNWRRVQDRAVIS